MEAAQLYKDDWAPEVWLTSEVQQARDAAMAELGIRGLTSAVYNIHVLERLGVPEAVVRVLPESCFDRRQFTGPV